MSRRRPRFRLDHRTIIGLAGLAGLTIGVGWWRATSIVNRLLQDWAVGVVAQQSDSVYRLDRVGVHVNWLLRRVAVDSFLLTTNHAVNARHPRPLADVRISLSHCAISGVHVFTLVRGAGLIAGSLGCAAGSVAVEVPRRVPDSTTPAVPPTPGSEPAGFLVLQQGLRLPSYAPRLQVAQITFPDLAFELRLPRGRNSETRVGLERLQWHMVDLVIDPADASAAYRPLFSRTIEVVVHSFIAHPDSAFAVRVDLLRASLTDSTLEARGVSADIAPSPRHRRDLIKLTVGHAMVQGVAFGAFVFGQGARARRFEADSFGINVMSDGRLPQSRTPQPDRTPQQWVADLDVMLRLDTAVVRNGEVVYREQRVGRDQPGVVTFAGVQATAVNMIHAVDRRTGGDTMSLAVTARLQNVGPIDAHFVMPLDASQFDMTFGGTLGAMPAAALNTFVEEVSPLRIADGRVVGITFNAAVRHGVARGWVTPRFNDLSVSVMRRGSGGILGDRGIVGGAARGIASMMANWEVRGNNPDHPSKPPLSGRIRHAFRSDETLPAFLWAGVWGGLLLVVKQ
jgi:hypothetical protein